MRYESPSYGMAICMGKHNVRITARVTSFEGSTVFLCKACESEVITQASCELWDG